MLRRFHFRCFAWIYTSLHKVGIELVFFVDGSRGSCAKTLEYKGKTWWSRAKDQYAFYGEIADGELIKSVKQYLDIPTSILT